MTTNPPVWLLDVDGVINVNQPEWHAAPRRGTAYAGGRESRLRWAPKLIDRIRTLYAGGLVEIRWCTTWCAYADQLERLFRLPELGRAFTGDINGWAAGIAKLAAAQQVLADGRRLIWTDDTEVPDPEAEPVLHAELTAGGRALLIRPDKRRGLTPEHVDEIEAFCTVCTEVSKES